MGAPCSTRPGRARGDGAPPQRWRRRGAQPEQGGWRPGGGSRSPFGAQVAAAERKLEAMVKRFTD
eukprot:11198759-Lingulodinium_polyedra.AAC.1